MKFLSVCSGIEAASVAWDPLGWKAAAFAEVDKFPSAVLAHHYPTVPNFGDMTKFKGWPDATIDVLVGGTPCQSFSVAGLRKGLADPRGNLALVYLAIADRYRPRWVVWESVPGVLSSSDGRDFGSFLGGLGELGYGWAYRVLDAQYFGVAQRRRRVFVVGCLGGWQRAAAVLFEPASLRGDPPPRRKAGQGFAQDVVPSLVSSGRGVERPGETRGQDPVVAVPLNDLEGVSHALNGKGTASGYMDGQVETYVGEVAPCLRSGGNETGGDRPPGTDVDTCDSLIAHTLRAEGFDAGEDGTGRGTPIVPIVFDCKASGRNGFGVGDMSPTLRAMGHKDSHSNAGSQVAAMVGWRVRRLTPRECERLQGFPDDYTAIPCRGKPAADGPRYKALGNSMAVPVMRWIGERIQAIDAAIACGNCSKFSDEDVEGWGICSHFDNGTHVARSCRYWKARGR